ncbi:MAG TPA: S46 family peptidase, partial [Rhodothermales bacterium]|nr:S46 family peptidase [Rhodothermales bacterium]
YNGGKYSAYTFHRYHDVRLVMAPEEQIAFFGGAPDNFTYPRYDLDMSWFRVYGPDGKPLNSSHYFPFSKSGSKVGEAVFVVGNPGSTSRLNTVAQLQFERQYALPQQLDILRTRARILEDYIAGHEEEAEQYDLHNALFSVQNSLKALGGELEGLRSDAIMLRRKAAERQLQQAIQANDTLRSQYGNVIAALEDLQRSKEATANQAGAFTYFGSDEMESHVLLRALYGYIYDLLRQRGAPEEQLTTYREGGLEVKDWPKEVDQAFLAARLRELQRYFGANDPTVRRILGGRTPEQVAQQVVSGTALTDSAGFANLLERGYLSSNDPTVALINAIAPLYFALSDQQQNLEAREQNLNAKLARARFVVYGTQIPPDATFSLRIADGVVKPYPYNGTLAPAYTTMYGVYDRHYSFPPSREEWDLPQRWLNPPPEFQKSTPLDLVSTNDITGGNSGSPLLNKNLEVVGLIFDGNIESLPSVYVYTDTFNRAVSVDSRGIVEALGDMYDADRIVLELTQQQLADTEEEADAMMSAK